MKSDKVSVLMCVYNGEQYLEEAIDSILKQTYKNIELVICNDGSTDRTDQILDSYKKLDSRVVILQKENTGLTLSLKYALEFCSGKWIARQDADDISEPERIEKQISYCKLNKIEFCTTKSKIINKKTSIPRIKGEAAFSPRVLKYGNIHVHGTFFFKKEILKKVQYNEQCRVAQDFDFILQCINLGVKCGLLEESLYNLRIHDRSISKKNGTQQIETAIASLERSGFSSKFYIEDKKLVSMYMLKIIKFFESVLLKKIL